MAYREEVQQALTSAKAHEQLDPSTFGKDQDGYRSQSVGEEDQALSQKNDSPLAPDYVPDLSRCSTYDSLQTGNQ